MFLFFYSLFLWNSFFSVGQLNPSDILKPGDSLPLIQFNYNSEIKFQVDSIDYSQESLNYHFERARFFRSNYQYDEAIHHAFVAQEIASELKKTIAEADANRLLGIMFSETGLFEKSYDLTFKSLEIYQKEDNVQGEILAMINIANDFSDISKYDLAQEFYFQALEKAEQLSDTNSITSIYHNLGFLFSEINQLEKAEYYFQESIKRGELLKNNLQLGISYMQWAKLLGNQNKDEQAILFFEKAQNILDEHNSQIHIARLQLLLSQFYLNRDVSKSINHAHRCLAISEAVDLITIKIPAVYQFYEIYDAIGDEENSAKYELLYYKLRFNLEEDQDLSRILLLEKAHQWESEKQKRLLENQKRRYQLYLVIFTLTLIMSITFLFLYNRYVIHQKDNLLKQQKLTSQLELKNKELILNTMSLMKIKSMEEQVIEKLKEISANISDKKAASDFNNIVRKLEHSSSKDIWKEFELRFKEVHQSFYESLIFNFPDLTANEIRLAAFIKLNLSTKDIAELTAILPSSVEVARARLRKKLGITHTDISIYSFLNQFK